MHERVFNPSEVHKLEDPERLKWLPPSDVLGALSLHPGMIVADIGAGSGYFAIPIARAVESEGASSQRGSGHVFAVDFQQEMLEFLRQKLSKPDAPGNIEAVLGSATETTLPDASCDLALLANVWHEIEEHKETIREAARILKPSGKIAILDWRPDVTRPPGPPLEHRISPQVATETLRTNGWLRSHWTNVGEYSYLLLCERN